MQEVYRKIDYGTGVFYVSDQGNFKGIRNTLTPYLEKDGASGVESYLTKVQNELRYIMSNTGFAKVSDIDDSALWFN